MSAHQRLAGHLDHAVLHRVLRAQGTEGLEVLVNGARAQITPAGHGHLAGAETAQQSAQEIIAGPHLAAQLVRHLGGGDVAGVDLVAVFGEHADLGAQGAEDLQRHRHVADVGQIFDDALIRRKDGSRQDRHRRVLRTADGNFAGEGLAPVDHKFLQLDDLRIGTLAGSHRAMPGTVTAILYTERRKKGTLRGSICRNCNFYAQKSQRRAPFSALFRPIVPSALPANAPRTALFRQKRPSSLPEEGRF